MSLYLIGSDRKQRPHARRAFCHRLRAAMALLNVTGIGLSPRWNLQNGTRPACIGKKTQQELKKPRESDINKKHFTSSSECVTSLKASLNSPPGAMPSCSVMWAETLSRRICIRPDISPFWWTEGRNKYSQNTPAFLQSFLGCVQNNSLLYHYRLFIILFISRWLNRQFAVVQVSSTV